MRQRAWLIFGIGTVALFLAVTLRPIDAMGDKAKKYSPKKIEQEESRAIYAPKFSLNSINHGKITSKNLKGKVVFVNFWATWCPPCVREIPHLQDLHEKYKDKGFVMLGPSLDQDRRGKTGNELVSDFIAEHGITYPMGVSDQETVDKFGKIKGIPTTYVINRDGKIVDKLVGYRDYDTFKEAILKHL